MPSNIKFKRLLFPSFIIWGFGAGDTCGEGKWLNHTKLDTTSSKMHEFALTLNISENREVDEKREYICYILVHSHNDMQFCNIF